MDPSTRDRRELRLALVLNGGVSLAIWIGGVVAEIDRARRAGITPAEQIGDECEQIYRALLDLTDTVVRTDVIAGASAGGLNGCLLAIAIANDRSVSDVRDLWIELGSFRDLLRSGLDPEPPSVLKGDDYFLPKLEEEFAKRSDPGAVRARLRRPGTQRAEQAPEERVRLLVTGTDLLGEPHVHRDDFGGELHDREHRALFVVEHDPERGTSTFDKDDAPRRLARIARSTASFPGAFEASFCRVEVPPVPPDEAAEPKQRDPNLFEISTMSSDRWVADGGILDNAPFRPALAAIAKAPSRGPVRRVLCYVTPYGAPRDPGPVTREGDPAFSSVIGAAFELPRSLAMTETLERFTAYRRRVGSRRAGRLTLLARLGDNLRSHAQLVFDLYCRQRALSSIDDVLDRLCGVPPYPAGEWSRTRTRPPVSAELLLATGVKLPWVPESAMPGFAPAAAIGLDALVSPQNAGWPWGLAPIARSARLVLDALSRALAITPPLLPGQPLDEPRRNIFGARQRLSHVLEWVDTTSEKFLDAAAADFAAKSAYDDAELVALNGGEPLELEGIGGEDRRQLAALLLACRAYRAAVTPDACSDHMRSVVKALGQGGPEALVLLRGSDLAPQERSDLSVELSALLYGPLQDATPDADVRHERLLRTEIAYEALAPSRGEHDQRLDLLRINAEAPCALDGREAPEKKLTGLGLAHFAAFYKRSWRANDWMWGRLDGACRLADLLVDPTLLRLRLAAVPVSALESEVATVRDALLAISQPSTPEGAFLRDRFRSERGETMEDALSRELSELAEWRLDATAAPSLEASRYAVAARLQLAVVAEELRAVHDATRLDVTDGASPDAAGRVWAERHPLHALEDPERLVAALRDLRLAEQETLAAEAGSNLLTRNVATTAAVAASAMSVKRSGLPGPARFVARALRGILLAVYGLAWSLTSARPGAKLAGIVALLVAVGLVAWGLAADVDARTGGEGGGPPGWLAIPARLVVGAALLLGIVRAGKAGLFVAVGFVIAYCLAVLWPWPSGWREGFERFWETSSIGTLLVVLSALGVTAGLVVGRGPFGLAYAQYGATRKEQLVRWVALVAAVVAVLAAAATVVLLVWR